MSAAPWLPHPQRELPTLVFPVAQSDLWFLCLGALVVPPLSCWRSDRQDLGISSLMS